MSKRLVARVQIQKDSTTEKQAKTNKRELQELLGLLLILLLFTD